MEKGKLINEKWNDDNQLNFIINDCLDIENNIKIIQEIRNAIENNNSLNIKINFNFSNEEINKLNNEIKNFGKVGPSYYFKFKKCPNNISDERRFEITGKNQNIFTKTGIDKCFMGSICENILKENKEYIWKVKILKSKSNIILVGVAPSDFDIYSLFYII